MFPGSLDIQVLRQLMESMLLDIHGSHLQSYLKLTDSTLSAAAAAEHA